MRAHTIGTRGLYPRHAHTVGLRGLWYPSPDTATEIVLDDTLISVIYTIVEEYGKDVTFIERNEVYSPITGATVGGTESHTRKVTPPEIKRYFKERDIIQVGSARVYLPSLGLPFDPHLGMQVIIDGASYRIVKRKYIYAITEVGAYELILKR